MSLKESRIEYKKGTLSDDLKNESPFDLFKDWLELAKKNVVLDFNAMSLNTNSPDGFPSSRIVLLREFTEEGFVFYTNYNSTKGKELEQNHNVSLNFFWRELEKQVRVKGTAVKVSSEVSNVYFSSRPRKSQIGAWVSNQSEVIQSRETLIRKNEELEEAFKGKEVTRPPHWGGYLVIPNCFEFWQGRSGRLHDRLKFSGKDSLWSADRLSP
ncbi:MAG: pyridoxamine 5'-phosphate oxidase [Flavobacteriales bacterium]